MRVLNIREAKTKLSFVLVEVEKSGARFLICRNGQPVAKLIPYMKRSRTKIHPVMSKIKINCDPTETLTEKEWPRMVT